MGQQLASLTEISPITAVSNGVQHIFTTATYMYVMLVNQSVTVVGALCSGFRHLKHMSQTVLPARVHIVVANELWYNWNKLN